MRKIKKILFFTLVASIACLSVGCGKKKNETKFDPNANLDLENIMFDDFTNGIDRNTWEIANQKWGVGNGGVIYQNVHYTENGELALQANGDNYEGDLKGINAKNGKRTGAALISNEAYGPGRYEIRMKAMPRFGATTAFWTFYNDGTENAEIDIELNINNDFHTASFTNWITEKDDDHRYVDTSVLGNDGEYHTYKFEWHTNPGRVDYYIDDVLYYTSTTYIPQSAGRLWLGVWFPDSWAGTPDFETDYMFVDWVRYTPYKNNPYFETSGGYCKFAEYYPTEPIEAPSTNWISNGSFVYDNDAWRSEYIAEDPENVEIKEGSLWIPEEKYAYQILSGLDESMDLILRFKYKSAEENGSGTAIIEYRPLATELIKRENVELKKNSSPIDENGWITYEAHLTLPAGTKRIELTFYSNVGTLLIDDVYLNLKNRTKE